MKTNKPMLCLSNITRKYGNIHALNGISITLTSGIYGILGENGAGKSTLLNIMANLLTPTSGLVTYKSEEAEYDIIDMGEEYHTLIGYMPQQQNVYDEFSGIRFLRYMSYLKGLPKKVIKKRIDEVLEIVHLTDDAHRKVKGYSGGMKQRLLLAAALLNDPQILLLDEPTAGLDPKERIRLRNYISKISLNKIVILATHIVPDIDFIADKVMIIKNGHLIKFDTPSNLIKGLTGKVYIIDVKEDEISMLENKFLISNLSKDQSIKLRLIADAPPEGYQSILGVPNLEDVYLYEARAV